MILVTGTFRLPTDRVDEARHAMRRLIVASRAETGCFEYGFAEDVLVPGLIHVHELWADRESLDQHCSFPHVQEWRAKWAELAFSDRDLVSYEVSQPAPL